MIKTITMFAILTVLPLSFACANEIVISDDGTSAGYITLSWGKEDGGTYELNEIKDNQSISLYRGMDNAVTLSGLPDGVYHYKLDIDNGEASYNLSVTVKHHSLFRAFMFLTLGAIMFITLIILLFGADKFFTAQYPDQDNIDVG